MQNLFYAAIVIAVGALLPVQAGMNSTLQRALGHPFRAGMWNFTVGLSVFVVLALATRSFAVPSVATLRSVPTWTLFGGCIGASIVLSGIMLAPKLGGALLFALVVFGQLASGLILDHFGVAGFERNPATVGRVAGVLVVLAGVALIQRG